MISSADIPEPFESYSGEGPYIFVSYAHADKIPVYQSMREFRDAGVNMWYDEGIQPAGEWVEEIAHAIKKSSMFVVFVSPRSVDSRFVKSEVGYALSENKDIGASIANKVFGNDQFFCVTQNSLKRTLRSSFNRFHYAVIACFRCQFNG